MLKTFGITISGWKLAVNEMGKVYLKKASGGAFLDSEQWYVQQQEQNHYFIKPKLSEQVVDIWNRADLIHGTKATNLRLYRYIPNSLNQRFTLQQHGEHYVILPAASQHIMLAINDMKSPELYYYSHPNNQVNQLWKLVTLDAQGKPFQQPILKVVSYNIAYNNQPKRWWLIVKYLLKTMPDVICLQEVNKNAFTELRNSLEGMYDYLAGSFVPFHHDVVIFSHKAMKCQIDGVMLAGHPRRSVLRAQGEYAGQKVVFTTAHMQSEFFTSEGTRKKAAQLMQISQLLEACPATIKFHIGDTNLTGGPQLCDENKAITNAGLVDLWPKLTTDFDPAENQGNEDFQTRDATWRSPENPVIQELQGTIYEHHRPDRVLMNKASWALVDQKSTTMTLLKENWSDHDGLLLHMALKPTSWDGSEIIYFRGDDGSPIKFESNAQPGGIFKYPLFFNKSAQISAKQRTATPVLLISSVDWNTISDASITHEGAFGKDFAECQVTEKYLLHESSYDLRGKRWFFVWKFPADLNYLAGFKVITHTPLPVGTYRFLNDGWWETNVSIDKELPHTEKMANYVTKMRIDLPGPQSVHHLEDYEGRRVAMLGSRFFIKKLWSVNDDEKQRVVQLLKDLREILKIAAFPCYSQHHAIVLYVDEMQKCRITPEHLCRIMQDETRGPVLLSLLLHYGEAVSIQQWWNNYCRIYS